MIKIKDLNVKFDKTILNNVNLQFGKTGVYCIYAPSGTGKTTLLNAIAGLIKYQGEINVEGKISYLFQDDRLLNWLTAKENINLVEPNQKAEYYMKAFGVDEFKNKKPQEMSGGMKRRCALVRAFAFEADIYLLDEPFRGLDEENAQKVRDEISLLKQNKLVIIVTHDEEDAIRLNAEKILL